MNRYPPSNRRQTTALTRKENERRSHGYPPSGRMGSLTRMLIEGKLNLSLLSFFQARRGAKNTSDINRVLFLSSIHLLNENPFSLLRLNYSKTDVSSFFFWTKWFSTTAYSRFKQRTILNWRPKKARRQLSKRKQQFHQHRRILGFIRKT